MCIRGARQKYGSNSTYFRGTPLFVAYYRDQISRIYASSTAALVQNLAVFALEKIGKSSRSLSIVILKNSKKRNDSRHGTNRFSQGPPNTTHIWARDQFSVQTRAQILGSTQRARPTSSQRTPLSIKGRLREREGGWKQREAGGTGRTRGRRSASPQHSRKLGAGSGCGRGAGTAPARGQAKPGSSAQGCG